MAKFSVGSVRLWRPANVCAQATIFSAHHAVNKKRRERSTGGRKKSVALENLVCHIHGVPMALAGSTFCEGKNVRRQVHSTYRRVYRQYNDVCCAISRASYTRKFKLLEYAMLQRCRHFGDASKNYFSSNSCDTQSFRFVSCAPIQSRHRFMLSIHTICH